MQQRANLPRTPEEWGGGERNPGGWRIIEFANRKFERTFGRARTLLRIVNAAFLVRMPNIRPQTDFLTFLIPRALSSAHAKPPPIERAHDVAYSLCKNFSQLESDEWKLDRAGFETGSHTGEGGGGIISLPLNLRSIAFEK